MMVLGTAVVGVITIYGLRRGGSGPAPSGGAAGGQAPAAGTEFTLLEQISHDKPIMDLGVAKDGTIYVMDAKGIQVRSGGAWGKRVDLPWEPSGWNFVSVGPEAVFLTRPGSGSLYRMGLDLEDLTELPLEGGRELTGVASTKDGGAYVSDVGADAVFRVDAAGKVLARWGGENGAALKDPRALSVGDDGDVYLVDSGLNQILRFSADGKLKKSWDGPWERPTLERLGVARGMVYVNNHLGGGVWIMTTSGKLEGLCRRSNPEFPMPGPAQLCAGEDGYLYVGSSTIGKFLLP